MSGRSSALFSALLAGLTAGCAASAEPPPEPPHGYVAGAEEAAEPQSRLVVADHLTGTVRLVDLITERVEEVARVDGPAGLIGDGRFAYVPDRSGRTRILDSGAWMVDHTDHVHYYRAAPRDLGPLPAPAATAVHTDPAATALTATDGAVRLLDRAALERGAVELLGPPTGETAVPYRSRLVAAGADGAVRVLTREGREESRLAERCPEPAGRAVTRRGVVLGCADGALLVAEDGGRFTGRRIPYPRPVAPAERATAFTHRPSTATLAAPGGERGVWSLDAGRGSWTWLDVGPVVAVNTAGDAGPLLTLTADGVLHAWDVATGRRAASTRLLSGPVPADGPRPVIVVDTARAYVNDVAAGTVHEVDYNDGLRRAREFRIGGAASYLVETGE